MCLTTHVGFDSVSETSVTPSASSDPQLDNLPENSPMNIVQTPIPITTSVPKRAKSQRKKALAAALATAQEYSEISMEQRKLQVRVKGQRLLFVTYSYSMCGEMFV